MLPEERVRIKIDKQLNEAGWDIVTRNEYVPKSAAAVKEALMQGNTESDYLLFVDDKAIAVVEAKREENPLADDVENQAEGYPSHMAYGSETRCGLSSRIASRQQAGRIVWRSGPRRRSR